MADVAATGVLLCGCHGRIDASLLQDIRDRLHSAHPDLPVVASDNLCDPQVLSRLVKENRLGTAVLAACSQLGGAPRFWEEPETAGVDPFSVRTVDVLSETSLKMSQEDLVERLMLMLGAQLGRQAHGCRVTEQALAVRFDRPQGEISRREMFTTLLPRYRVVPYVQPDRCRGTAKCGLCATSCHGGAVLADEGRMVIDKAACSGCGLCTAACPFQAISYPTFSAGELQAEIEALLEDRTVLQPRIVAMVCRSSSPSWRDETCHAPNVLPLEVPCLGMASPWLVLRAIELGAQGVAMVADKETCGLGMDCGEWQGSVEFVQGLLQSWGISPVRVAVIDGGRPGQALAGFADRIAGMAPLYLNSCRTGGSQIDGMLLPELVAGLTERLAPSSDAVVGVGSVPFGRVEIDASKCTGCGVCVVQCPTGALHYAPGGDALEVRFSHGLCVGCGECARICPERCLGEERVLDLGRINGPAETVYGDEVVRCRACGGPVAPRAMIDRLRSRLEAAGAPTSQLEICPECRTRGRSGSASIMVGA